jgi:hypothetical protein
MDALDDGAAVTKHPKCFARDLRSWSKMLRWKFPLFALDSDLTAEALDWMKDFSAPDEWSRLSGAGPPPKGSYSTLIRRPRYKTGDAESIGILPRRQSFLAFELRSYEG